MTNRATLNSYIKVNHLKLEEALNELAAFVCNNLKQICLYQLPVNKIGDEIATPTGIKVVAELTQITESSKRYVRNALTQLKIEAFKENTYLSKRFPGVLVLPKQSKGRFIELNDEVNRLRIIFSESVKVGFEKRQVIHQNLHELVPNLVLLNAVRKIKYLDTNYDEIVSVNFYWRSKKMQQHVKHDAAKSILDSSIEAKNFEVFGLSKDELVERHKKEMDLISRVPSSSKITEIRFARVQPLIDIWCKNIGDTRSQRALSTNATLPIVLFDTPKKINTLKDYVYSELAPINHPILIPRKHWYLID